MSLCGQVKGERGRVRRWSLEGRKGRQGVRKEGRPRSGGGSAAGPFVFSLCLPESGSRGPGKSLPDYRIIINLRDGICSVFLFPNLPFPTLFYAADPLKYILVPEK